MSNRSNTRWGARQPPRRGGGGGGHEASGGYDQNYDDYNYGHYQQYGASGGYNYDYESYDQTQGNYDRNSQSGNNKRYPSNRSNYETGTNYYYNPPPRHAKNFAENNNNSNYNNKTNPTTTKKPVKEQQETKVVPEPVVISTPPPPTPPIEQPKPVEPSPPPVPVEEPPTPVVEPPPPEENLDTLRAQVSSYLTERHDRFKQRQELREQNLRAEQNRPNAEQQQEAVSRLDSSIKRIPPFIKRLRTLTEQQRDALCRDMQTLNLTRYISEVATALTEAKLKMTDVWTSVQICSLLHQRYPDFSGSLYENWLKVLNKDTLTDNLSKVRVDLRLFAELITVHVLPANQSMNHLVSLLTTLTNNDKDFSNLTILISFCRLCGEDYAEIFSTKIRKLITKLDENIDESSPKSSFHSQEIKQQIRQMLIDYFQKLALFLLEEHKQLQKQNQQLQRTMEVNRTSL